MTRVVRDRILKDANGDINDHLRNHIHLTNCIHLKNHMHKQSPILTDRSLMRDLIVLQRSRSLRDPSASPPSWQSPSVADILLKKVEKDTIVREGRRSVGIERRREGRKLSGSSPPIATFATSKVAPSEVSGGNDGIRDARRIRREQSSQMSDRNGVSGPPNQDGNNLIHEVVSGNSESKIRSRQKGKHLEDVQAKTLSEQLNDVMMDSDDVVSSNVHLHDRRFGREKTIEEPETSMRGIGYGNGLNRGKRRKFRGTRRNRAAATSRDIGATSELSVASNSLAQDSACPKCKVEEDEVDHPSQHVTNGPRNGCGLPWNWSRIHNRGKTFLDLAGRSFSCGLSESRLRKGGRDISNAPIASDQSSSPIRSDGEALPLLVEASGSPGSTENAGWARDYSGELGIFADNLYEREVVSDDASEARSGDQRKPRGHHRRHQSLTQKYTPRNFRDLVGQNLVAQALSNAVMKKKVGLLYVFYGPHGTGKTSCARIFARALNCQSVEHSRPCGFCNSCIAYDMDKSRNIREVGPVSNIDLESIMELLDDLIISQLPSQYKVFIFDDCDTLSSDCWSALSKVIDRAPRRMVIILVCSSLDVLPHIIISRCQKFFFPKLKDADIIYTLQWIATKEDLEIDKDALKLIASRSDGSLRDAEMTLEQLSLLGQRISVPLVQELVGLISDEKLVDLLDLALSADTVNTVKNLRVIMETGVDPLALMSQLATVITDILAGSYDYMKEQPRRKFFRRQPLSKDDMEKLRQALKVLSEAEKQLRMSNDKLTWLTAALLQLAPDQQYMISTSAETSFNHSPMPLNNVGGISGMPGNRKGGNKSISLERKRRDGAVMASQQTPSSDIIRLGGKQTPRKSRNETEEIWLEVLERIQIGGLKKFLSQEGKLISVSFGAAPTVQLTFSSHLAKSTAEKFREQILKAFESVLGSPMTIEIRSESKTDHHLPLPLPAPRSGSSHARDTKRNSDSHEVAKGEIVELAASPRERNSNELVDNHVEGSEALRKKSNVPPIQERRKTTGDESQSLSIVRSKVSLAHVIQQAEGYSQRNGWSKRKAVSIAEKLEQENLRLEPQSRSLLCWKASKITRRKLSRLKIRARRPRSLLRLVSCGKCLTIKSPR